jgi:serpin B
MRTVRSLVAAPAAGLAAFMLVSAPAAGPARAEAAIGSEARELAERMNRLGGEALGRLAGKRADSTLVVSPYGLGSALHLLLLGASGPAEKSLQAKLLPPAVVPGRQDSGLTMLRQHVLGSGGDKLQLTVSSAAFVPKSAEAARRSVRFVARAHDIFAAPVEVLDFRSAAALERINGWAREATRGLIPGAIDELDPDARFVLANAVYFNGAWETAFSAARTSKAPFTRVDGSTRDVAMMDATIPANFAEFDGLQAVWLPYAGGAFAMLVVAPPQGSAPAAMAEALQRESITDLVVAAQRQRRMARVQVRLPRFRAESKLDVTDALSGQGLKPAFTPGANYNAINASSHGPLEVTHRAVVEVSEQGTRAAAVTAIVPERSLSVMPLISADRPFAFAIVHGPTQAILFAGYVADPADGPAPATPQPETVR